MKGMYNLNGYALMSYPPTQWQLAVPPAVYKVHAYSKFAAHTCMTNVEMHVAAADPSHDTLRPYVAFHAALRSAYHSFIAHLEDNCKSLMRHHLEAATSEFAVTALAGKLPFSCCAFP